jgi:Homeodomain-like domain-containing protein
MFSRFRKEEPRRSAEEPVDFLVSSEKNGLQAPPDLSTDEKDSGSSALASTDTVVAVEARDTTEPLIKDDAQEAEDATNSVVSSPEERIADPPFDGSENLPASEPSSESPEEESPNDLAPTLWRSGRLVPRPRAVPRGKNLPLMQPLQNRRGTYSPHQRILLLDTWQRSGLPAKDFADLIGISKHTLYKWKQLFEKLGPEGLLEQPRQR